MPQNIDDFIVWAQDRDWFYYGTETGAYGKRIHRFVSPIGTNVMVSVDSHGTITSVDVMVMGLSRVG